MDNDPLTAQFLFKIDQSNFVDADGPMSRQRYASVDEVALHTHVVYMNHAATHIKELQTIVTRIQIRQQYGQIHRFTRTSR